MKNNKQYYDEAAQRISDGIDEEIRKDSVRRNQRKKKEVKVMLLGQAESGKSTLQKQFQLLYASQELDHERPSWRPVVYFNILKALGKIFDQLDYELSTTSKSPKSHSSSISVSSRSTRFNGASELRFSDTSITLSDEVAAFRSTLNPLMALKDALASELSGGVQVVGGRTGVYVRAGWQTLISPRLGGGRSSTSSRTQTTLSPRLAQISDAVARMLFELWREVERLWALPAVHTFIRSRQLLLDESAPFFLDDIERIAEPGYLPSTDDILNVRLQTIGVREHSMNINVGGNNIDWVMYDVGGARGHRHTWVPYFDDATAIIFLAPISAFDQYLEEDSKTNRIDDSLQLFTAICSNKLLKKAHLVIMLNKADLLKKKLEDGIKVRKFITSYGDRPNLYEEVSEYFRAHFIQVHRRKDIAQRPLYLHFTSMLDVRATQRIIGSVGEAIIRSYISETGLM